MKVIPVLDLRNGLAVHARGGVRERYAPLVSQLAPEAAPGDTRAIAAAYRRMVGDSPTYVADLDVIGGGEQQRGCIGQIVSVGPRADVWVDGGIATAAHVEAWAGVPGVSRLIVGLETLASEAGLAEIVAAAGSLGMGTAFSVDLRGGEPVVRAPTLQRRTPEELAEIAADAGFTCVIVIDLGRVGSGAGLDERLLRRIRRAIPRIEFVAGGGVRDGDDLRRLAALGAHGALVGSALHDGRIGRAEIQAVAG